MRGERETFEKVSLSPRAPLFPSKLFVFLLLFFPCPGDALSRQLRTRRTVAGLARWAFRLTAEVNSGYWPPPTGLLTSPGIPER